MPLVWPKKWQKDKTNKQTNKLDTVLIPEGHNGPAENSQETDPKTHAPQDTGEFS